MATNTVADKKKPTKFTKYPLLHMGKLFNAFLIHSGYTDENIAEIFPIPNRFRFLLNILPAIPVIFMIVIFCDNIILFIQSAVAGDRTAFMTCFIYTNNSGLTVGRYLAFLLNRPTMKSFMQFYNRIVVTSSKRKHQLVQFTRTSTYLTKVSVTSFIVCMCISSSFVCHQVYLSGRVPDRSIFPVENIPFGLFYEIFGLTYCWMIAQTSFFWAINFYCNTMTAHFSILNAELKEFYSVFYVDSKNKLRVRKRLVNHFADDLSQTVSLQVLFSTKINKNEELDFYNYDENLDPVYDESTEGELITKINKGLTKWIERHYLAMEQAGRISKMFSAPLLMTYFSLVIMLFSLVFLPKTLKGMTPDTSVYMQVTYSLINLYLFFVICESGQNLKDKSVEVPNEAFGTDWHVYPLPMQKALMIILNIAKGRPQQMYAFGLLPLTREMFAGLIQFWYTCYTFLSEMDF